jgi:ribose transport system ATP-binding protein
MGLHSKEILVRVDGIHKKFGGINVLQDVSFTLNKGEIMGLSGHNGAGKSVLVKTIGGIFKPDKGKILFGEEEVRLNSPKDAQDRGYFVVPQELNLARKLSVADNIFIGRSEFATKRLGIINKKFINEESKRLLNHFFGVKVDPTTQAGELDTVSQRLVQVVRCLRAGAKVIVFDETTAGLSQHEREKLFEHMKLLSDKGIGIIFISHMISEMMNICDSVTALRGGRLIGVEKIENLTHTKVIEMIVGKEYVESGFEKPSVSNETLLHIRDLSTKNGRLSNINFDLKKGEILGIYGLRDQGQSLLMETLFGAYKKGMGEIELEGKKVKINSPKDAITNGVTFLPERGHKSVFPSKSIVENLVVKSSNFIEKGHYVKKDMEKQKAIEVVKKFSVRGYSSLDKKLTSLSGGNMQKVLIARSMMINPKVLMLIEPTQGIDIGAKEEVKELILHAAKQGKGIIISTAEIDDIIEICNRVIIIKDGKLRAILDADEKNKELIMEESTK